MLIDNLNIQCFRGISDSLSLDFTAHLTVLYAPNGTGKTSICDAVEWVLCGGVGRLGKDESFREGKTQLLGKLIKNCNGEIQEIELDNFPTFIEK